MTKKLLLALALTLATAPLTSATAFACGGYSLEHPETSAIRQAVERRVTRVFRAPPFWVYDVVVEGDRATARVRLRSDSNAERAVRLHRRDGAWRVVAFG